MDCQCNECSCGQHCQCGPEYLHLHANVPALSALAAAADIAKALADPTRLGLLSAVHSTGPAAAGTLACMCAKTNSLMSHHLKTLREAELIDAQKQGRHIFYSITPLGSSWLALLLDEKIPV